MRLKDLLKFDEIVIQCHDNPDADAIACGYAVLLYLQKYGKSPSLVYGGRNFIRKTNLVMMIKDLEIPITHVTAIGNPELLLMVDCQYGGGNAEKFEAQNIAVIDHHRISTNLPELSEVRSNLGACSTLIWQMLKNENFNVTANKRLGTALSYGLYTDTSGFTEIVHPLDKDLRDEANVDNILMAKYRNANMSLEDLEVAGAALLNSDYMDEYRASIVKAGHCDPNILGVISDMDPQPMMINSHLGRFAIVTVAKINNMDELVQELLINNMHFSEMSMGKTNPTELVALLIVQGKDFVDGIENVFNKIKGSCSMLILTEDGIIVARDKWGRTPIIIGKKDGAYAATSESSSLPNLDFEIDKYVGPGEILRMRADGLEQLRKPNEKMQICSFLWVYYGFPVSCYEGKNVEEVRFMSGYKMGQTDESEVDCACGIPDSGVGMALGYAEGKGIPYHRAIAKYTPTWPRSFTPSNQNMRSLVAKMKLIPNRAMLQGKRLLFCDDSIVRGTQLRDNVNILYDYGAKEVHMRIACPPLIYGCPFIGFTSSKGDMELITRRIIKEIEGDENAKLDKYATTDSPEYKELVERIRARFGLTSLKFNTLETLIEAIGLPKCKVCTHCFDGSSCF